MGTRGCVGVRTGKDTWRGVYNHFDSYPTGLGEEVYEHVKKTGIKKVAREVLKYGDWREYLAKGICEYCGKKKGQPHTISGEIMGFGGTDLYGDQEKVLAAKTVEDLTSVYAKRSTMNPYQAEHVANRNFPIVQSIQKTGYPDPAGKYHSHGKGKADQMSNKKVDALFIEWMYLLDVKRSVIEVWSNRPTGKTVKHHGTDFPEYGHFKVTEVKLRGKKPDWAKIHTMANPEEDE